MNRRIPACALLLLSILLLPGCGLLRRVIPQPAGNGEKVHGTASARTGKQVVDFARTKLGCRYKEAGTGPNAFDCSGFTQFVFRNSGIELPRRSADQFKTGLKVLRGDQLRPGDLVFWSGRSGSQTVGHVGIVVEYLGGGRFTFIHASSHGVRIDDSSTSYYASRYLGARRVINN